MNIYNIFDTIKDRFDRYEYKTYFLSERVCDKRTGFQMVKKKTNIKFLKGAIWMNKKGEKTIPIKRISEVNT